MLTLEEKIARSERFAKLCGQAEIPEWKEECEQLVAWFRELQERRKTSAAPTEPQWIPVSERLPEEPGYYITSNEYNGVGEDFYYDGHFWNADKNAYSVIAWMPKPKAYKPNK